MGVPWEYPCESAVSVFVDGDLHVERPETGQKPEHPGYEQFEGKEYPVVAKVEREALDERASCHRGICEGEQEPYSALCRKIADIAVQGAFCHRIEGFVDGEDGVEVIWPGEKE
jgi:hypothetical protein